MEINLQTSRVLLSEHVALAKLRGALYFTGHLAGDS